MAPAGAGDAQESIDKMVERARGRGWVTYDELNAALPPARMSPEEIEEVLALLSAMGIDIVEGDSQPAAAAIRAMSADDLAAVIAYDAVRFGDDRAFMIEHLRHRMPDCAFLAESEGRVRGFVLARDGRAATQIGPLVADDDTTALGLLQHALRGIRDPVCLDVGDRHAALRHWLESHGFAAQATFIRMIYGRSEPFDDPSRIYAITGPELG
jgi:hypothetical protein